MLEYSLLIISDIFLQLDYFNPFDDPSDIVTQDDIIAGSVTVVIAGLSILLTTMTISAYRKTGMSQLKFIALAFFLFSVYLATEAMQELLTLNDDSFDLFLSLIMMGILFSFFLGIMRKKKNLADEK